MNYCCMSKMEWLGVTECQKSYPSQKFFSQMIFFFLLAVLTEGHISTMPSAVVLWMVQMFVLFALVCHTYRRLSCTKQVDESFHTHTATTLSSQGVYFRLCNYAIKNKPVVRLIAQTAAIRSCSHNSNVCNFCFSVCIVYFVGPSGVQNNFPFAGPLHSNAVAKIYWCHSHLQSVQGLLCFQKHFPYNIRLDLSGSLLCHQCTWTVFFWYACKYPSRSKPFNPSVRWRSRLYSPSFLQRLTVWCDHMIGANPIVPHLEPQRNEINYVHIDENILHNYMQYSQVCLWGDNGWHCSER